MFLLSFPLSLLVSLSDFLLSWGTFPLTESSSHRGPFRHKLSQTLQAILVLTLCVLCMPKAFCVLEMCAKRLRELCALCERKNSPASEEAKPRIGEWPFSWWHRSFLAFMKNIYKIRRSGSLFTMGMLVRRWDITYTFSEVYEYETRICLSCIKKMLFFHQEGHVLGCWRAFPWTLKGVGRIGERRKIFTRSGHVGNEDSVTQLTGKTDEDGKTGRSR